MGLLFLGRGDERTADGSVEALGRGSSRGPTEAALDCTDRVRAQLWGREDRVDGLDAASPLAVAHGTGGRDQHGDGARRPRDTRGGVLRIEAGFDGVPGLGGCPTDQRPSCGHQELEL